MLDANLFAFFSHNIVHRSLVPRDDSEKRFYSSGLKNKRLVIKASLCALVAFPYRGKVGLGALPWEGFGEASPCGE